MSTSLSSPQRIRSWFGFLRSRSRRGLVVAAVLLGLGGLGYLWLGSYRHAANKGTGSPWQQALEAIDAGDLIRARTRLNECLEIWPLNAEVNFLMARTCRRAGDVPSWRQYLLRAEVLQWARGDLDLERQLLQAQSGDVWSVEPSLLRRLESFDPDRILILEALVRGYLESERLQDVLRYTEYWSTHYPEDWQPHFFRGQAYYLTRRTPRAIVEYQRALELKPDQPETRLALAGTLSVDGRYQEALEQFQTYLQNYPDDATALIGLANCHLALAQRPAARAVLQKLVAQHNENAAACLIQAKLESEDDAPAEAWKWLQRAEALAPFETDITQSQIMTLRQLGKHEEADKYEQKLQELRRGLNRVEEIRKGLLQDPDQVALRFEAGSLCLQLHRDDQAARWLQSVLRLDPNHAATHKLLAEYFQKQGDTQRAQHHRRRAEGQSGAGQSGP